jgi:hypothetical protein
MNFWFYRFFAAPFRERFRGTLPPARLASERPIAMACFRLVTFFPDRPDFRVPRFRSSIARLTFSPAFFPYFAISISFAVPRW